MVKFNKSFFVFVIFLLVQLSCGFLEDDPLTSTATNSSQADTAVLATAVPTSLAAAQQPTLETGAIPAVVDQAALARSYLEGLIQVTGPRLPGSAEERQAANYIEEAFEEMGYRVERQPFSFWTEAGEHLNSTNLIAVKPGLSSRELVIGAHYDSGDEGDGADDNASGVAVLLATAERLIEVDTVYTIRFIAFGAEENDLDGSRFYVGQLEAADIHNIIYMINLDSLIAGDMAYLYGTEGGPGNLREWIGRQAYQAGFDIQVMDASELDDEDGTPCECADYAPFQDAGVNFMYFESTNWNLGDQDGMTQVATSIGEDGVIRHTRYDTIDYIDQSFPGRIDEQLDLYVTLLVNILTRFNPAQ